jgi:hypothetical protein
LTEVLPAQGYGLDLETKTGMLTRLFRSFADSKLTHADEGSPLNAIAFDQTSQIILELGQSCYLAVVVKGDPPISYLQRVEQRLQEIEDGYAEPIQTYEGDPSTVPVEIQTDLQPLLVIDPKRSKQRRPLMVVGTAALILGLVAGAIWGFFEVQNRRLQFTNSEVQRVVQP